MWRVVAGRLILQAYGSRLILFRPVIKHIFTSHIRLTYSRFGGLALCIYI